MTDTWLEVAINGLWGPDRQPGVPVSVEDCIEQGVACVEAGAAIVHVHAWDPVAGEQVADPDVYAEIIEGIRESVDAIVYPTIALSDTLGRPQLPPAERFASQDALGDRGLLEFAAIDPGTVLLTTYENISACETGFLNENTEAEIRAGLTVAQRHGAVPAYAIYGPGFLRTGAALAAAFDALASPIYRFMFSDSYTMSHPPEPYALDSYLELLEREDPDGEWMISGLGVDVTRLIPETVDRGGHVRVGLEDAPLDSGRSNVAWVEQAAEAIVDAGGRLATAAEIRTEMGR